MFIRMLVRGRSNLRKKINFEGWKSGELRMSVKLLQRKMAMV